MRVPEEPARRYGVVRCCGEYLCKAAGEEKAIAVGDPDRGPCRLWRPGNRFQRLPGRLQSLEAGCPEGPPLQAWSEMLCSAHRDGCSENASEPIGD
jgi:hypothetical protein